MLISSCLIFFIQLFLWLWLADGFKKVSLKQNVTNTESFSIVICTYNDAKSIKMNLQKFLQLNESASEIIVVNDHSTDNSSEILSRIEEIYPNLTIVIPEGSKKPGKKAALKAGIMAATNDTVILSDMDCYPISNNWSLKMAGLISSGTAMAGGYSPFEVKPTAVNKFARFENIITAFQMFGWTMKGMPYMITGRNAAYSKPALASIDFFRSHSHITPGDDDLTVQSLLNTSKLNLTLDPETFIMTEAADDWQTYFKQKRRHFSVAPYYKPVINTLLILFNFSWLMVYLTILFFLIVGLYKTAVVMLLMRYLLLLFIFPPVLKRLKQELSWHAILICDAVYPFLMGVLACQGIFYKNKTWK